MSHSNPIPVSQAVDNVLLDAKNRLKEKLRGMEPSELLDLFSLETDELIYDEVDRLADKMPLGELIELVLP